MACRPRNTNTSAKSRLRSNPSAGIDATSKMGSETERDWGKKIRMDDEVVDKVSAMWDELGLPGSGRPIWKK